MLNVVGQKISQHINEVNTSQNFFSTRIFTLAEMLRKLSISIKPFCLTIVNIGKVRQLLVPRYKFSTPIYNKITQSNLRTVHAMPQTHHWLQWASHIYPQN